MTLLLGVLLFVGGVVCGALFVALYVGTLALDLLRERDRALSQLWAMKAIAMRGVVVAQHALNFRAGVEGQPMPHPEVAPLSHEE